MKTIRFTLTLVAGLSLTACGDTLGPNRAQMIRSACTQTVNAYAFARDAIDADAYGALFTNDVSFTFAGDTMNGREALEANLLERGPAFVTRHYITSVMINPTGKQTATGSNNAIVYSPPTEAGGPPQPLSPQHIFALVRYDDEYQMVGRTCLISNRVVNIEYLRQDGD